MPAHLTRTRGLAALAALAAALLIALPACGGDDDEDSTSSAATTAAAPSSAAASSTEAPEAASTGVEATEGSDTVAGEGSTTAETAATDAATGAGTAAASPDEAAVRQAIADYIQAFVDKDGSAACDLLTDEAAQAFVAAVKSLVDTDDCAAAFEAAAGSANAGLFQAFANADVGDVTVSGDTATADIGVLGVTTQVKLAKVDGQWKVANLPGQ